MPRPVVHIPALGGDEPKARGEPDEIDELEGIDAYDFVAHCEGDHEAPEDDEGRQGEGGARVEPAVDGYGVLGDDPLAHLLEVGVVFGDDG